MGHNNTVLKAIIKKVGLAFNAAAVSKQVQNDYNSGVVLTIKVANVAGGITFTVKLQYIHPTDGSVVDVPGAVTAALAANGTYFLSCYAGNTVVANQAISQALPGNFMVVVTPAVGGSGDITIDAQLIA